MDDVPSRALREHSPELLRSGLRRVLRDGEEEWLKDGRDLMMALAPYHDCARRLGLDPAVFFDQAAEAAPPMLRDTVRKFGLRGDVSPAAFSFAVVEEPDGPRYTFT